MASSTTHEKLDTCCLTEYRPLPGTPAGQIITIADIVTYHISGNDKASKGKAIVLLTDIFGLIKNPRVIADEISEKTGFDVYVPDLFNGDPVPSAFYKNLPQAPGDKTSIGSKLGLVANFATLAPWLFRHRQAVTLPIVEKFLKTLRSEHGVTKIQAVGYCFGGLYILLLAGSPSLLVDAVVGCHVSMTTKNHFEQVQVPAGFVCAQEDINFSDALRLEAEQILARKSEIPSKFLLTEGTVHGFASRPDPDNPVVMQAYKQANDFIAEWAKTYL